MYDRSMLGSGFIPVLVVALACIAVGHLITIGFALYRFAPRSLCGDGYLRQKRALMRLGVLPEPETADSGDVGELVGTWRRICAWATIGGSIGGLAAGALVVPLAFSTPRDPTVYGSASVLHWFLTFLLVAAAQTLGLPIGRYAGYMAAIRRLPPLPALAARPAEGDALHIRDVRSPKVVWLGVLDLLCLVGLTALALELLAGSVQHHPGQEAFTFSVSIILAVLPTLAALGMLTGELLTRRLVRLRPVALTLDNALARRGFEQLRRYQLGFMVGMSYMGLGMSAVFEMVALVQVAGSGFIESSAYWPIMFGFFALYLTGFGIVLVRNGTFAARMRLRSPSPPSASPLATSR